MLDPNTQNRYNSARERQQDMLREAQERDMKGPKEKATRMTAATRWLLAMMIGGLFVMAFLVLLLLL